jgi:DNA-binding NarL/FixJ family response regulator
MPRILIADDHDVVRSGLRAVLEQQDGWEVVAEAIDGREAVQKAVATRPDIAVVDYALPIANGAEVTRQIRARVPSVEVLIFTLHDRDDVVREVLLAGAKGYLLKSDANKLLLAAIEALAAHKPFFTASVSEALLDAYRARSSTDGSLLTAREKSVVQLIAEGNPNSRIAEILSLSLKTVETHRASAMRKLNLKSTAAVVRYAIRNRLVEP